MSVEAENQRGIALCHQREWESAIACFNSALEIDPYQPSTQCNLGYALLHLNRLEEAIDCFRAALANDRNLLQAHNNLGIALSKQQSWSEAASSFENAIQLNPNFADAHCGLGVALREQQQTHLAIICFEKAIELNPQGVDAYCHLGIALAQIDQFEEAAIYFDQALQINSGYTEAYVNLCNTLYRLGDLSSMYEVAVEYSQISEATGDFRADLLLIRAALHSGRYQAAVEALERLETKGYNLSKQFDLSIFDNKLAVLYPEILFSLPYLRDDVAANARFGQLVAQSYFNNCGNLIPLQIPKRPIAKANQIRIGFISKGFCRMSEGWCNRDVIRELSIINSNIYLYATARFKPDDLTEIFSASSQRLFIPPSLSQQICLENEMEIVEEILNDRIDVLVDIDSVMTPIHTKILRLSPAPICITWQGFEPPIVSRQHYFLGDCHTHPAGVEQYYYEQLMRLPDSFLAVSGFSCAEIDVPSVRKSLEISTDQVVYLCMAIGLKFSRQLAKSHVDILRQVPNSVLLHKGSGDTDKTEVGRNIIRDTYLQECELQDVAFDRIHFLGRTATEEEHRSIYLVADVILDSYPFNGVTHTLEALWFELPIVTYAGEQLYSRASYSFMQNVGVLEGIAHSWEEYAEWGIRLGRDHNLRATIHNHLIQAKCPETLAPLWNPRKFASDFLEILFTTVAN